MSENNLFWMVLIKIKNFKVLKEYTLICFVVILYSNCSCAVLLTCGDFKTEKIIFLLLLLKYFEIKFSFNVLSTAKNNKNFLSDTLFFEEIFI